METLLTKEKQEELFLITNSTYQYYETKLLLRTPSIRLAFNNVTLPERIRIYQTVDGKTLNVVYQNENIIEILDSFTMVKMPNDTENELVFEKGEYGIIKNEKLSLDLVSKEDIEYVTKYRDLVSEADLNLKLHYEVVIDGVKQD